MYSMDLEGRARRSAVPSHAGAEAEAKAWVEANSYAQLRDGAGLVWVLTISVLLVADKEDPKALDRQVEVNLAVDVTAAELISTGTLDSKTDSRMIQLLGDEHLPLRLRGLHFTVPTDQEVQRQLGERLPAFRERFRTSDFHESKRLLIGRFLDQRSLFSKRY